MCGSVTSCLGLWQRCLLRLKLSLFLVLFLLVAGGFTAASGLTGLTRWIGVACGVWCAAGRRIGLAVLILGRSASRRGITGARRGSQFGGITRRFGWGIRSSGRDGLDVGARSGAVGGACRDHAQPRARRERIGRIFRLRR